MNSGNQFESRHKIGDTVTITAKVAGIQFSDSKVRYVFDLGEQLSIVDSEHVEPAAGADKSRVTENEIRHFVSMSSPEMARRALGDELYEAAVGGNLGEALAAYRLREANAAPAQPVGKD